MTSWITAAIIGLMIAALHYGRSRGRSPNGDPGRHTIAGIDGQRLAAILRAVAAAAVAAMLLGAPAGPARLARPLVALDASASWTRGDRALASWTHALASARAAAGGDSLWLFGDSLRATVVPPRAPSDRRSALGPVVDAARDGHRALVIVTDGEVRGGPELPAGSRLTVIAHAASTDAAVVNLIAPSRAAPGDTVTIRATVRAGGQPVDGARVTATLGAGAPVAAPAAALGAFAEREVVMRVIAPRGEREELLRVSVSAAGDVEPRNDTLSSIVEISRVPAAVLVSSSPDPDARAALEALSGALTARPRGFYQVARGEWRDATTLRAVSSADVRAAAAAAPLLVLHGDTALFGAPATFARSALVLMVPGDAGDIEWRAASRDGTPLSPSLAGISWDSIPPIDLPAAAPHGDWIALEGRSIGVTPRPVVAGGEANGRRRLVVAASGLWRWRARGGPARDAYDALWGAIADWTTSSPVDVRPALPARRWLREGEPVQWLRSGGDSVVQLSLRAASGDTSAHAITLHFSGDTRTANTPPLPTGHYTATMHGGTAAFVVNAGDELLPARASALTVARGAAPGGLPAPPLRERWWAYVLALAALCGEWVLRRRVGLR